MYDGRQRSAFNSSGRRAVNSLRDSVSANPASRADASDFRSTCEANPTREIDEHNRRLQLGTSLRNPFEARRVSDFDAERVSSRIDSGAQQEVAYQCEHFHIFHRPLKRAGANGATSTGGLRPAIRSAISSPVIADSKIPLRKWPVA